MTPHPFDGIQASRRAFGPATHVRGSVLDLGSTGLKRIRLGLENHSGSGGAAFSQIRDLGPVFGPDGPSGLNNHAYTQARSPKGSGGENRTHVKVGKLSPLSPSSPKNEINPLITNETKNLKSADFQAHSFLTKPVQPNMTNEETTGSAVVKQERNILKSGVEDQRSRPAEFLEAERKRMARVAAAARMVTGATPPDACGPRIIAAPARGASVLVPQASMVPNGKDKWEVHEAGWAGFQPVRAVDVFDRMGKAAADAERPAPFTPGQVAVARRYRALVERHDAGGIKCSDLVGRTGGSGRDFMDAYLAEGRELAALRGRIGANAAMAVRRVRPSARGGADRRTILDRDLVDMVCLGDRTLSDVLRAHGWATKGDTRDAVREALSGALDRMIGSRG